MLKKCITDSSFPDISLEEKFKVALNAGFEAIELTLEEFANRDLCLSMKSTEQELKEIKNLAKRYQLSIPSISTGLHWKYPFTDENIQVRNTAVDVLVKMIDVCRYFEGDTVLVIPGVVTSQTSYDIAYERAHDTISKVLKHAEKQECFLGLENVWNKFLLSPLEFSQFIDQFNHPNAVAYFDIGNVLFSGFPQHWIRILGKRIVRLHIKDFDCSIGNIYGFRNLLEGDLDYQAVVEEIKNIGYNGYITPELSPYKTNPCGGIFEASRSLDYINFLFNELD